MVALRKGYFVSKIWLTQVFFEAGNDELMCAIYYNVLITFAKRACLYLVTYTRKLMSCLAFRGLTGRDEDSLRPAKKIYHERQHFELCALHALNNVFQDPNAFTKEQLDEICSRCLCVIYNICLVFCIVRERIYSECAYVSVVTALIMNHLLNWQFLF